MRFFHLEQETQLFMGLSKVLVFVLTRRTNPLASGFVFSTFPINHDPLVTLLSESVSERDLFAMKICTDKEFDQIKYKLLIHDEYDVSLFHIPLLLQPLLPFL